MLEPQTLPGVDDALPRRLDELNRTVARIERDMAITTETLALFVRYFLTITPPLPQSEQEAGAAAGPRALRGVRRPGRPPPGCDRRLVSEVLETIAEQRTRPVRHRRRTTAPLEAAPANPADGATV